MKNKVRAKNNRTTFVTADEIQLLKKKLISANDINGDFYDKTILGELEEVAPKLPSDFVDLLFIDPPYNLNKDFGNNKFSVKKRKRL